MKIEDYALIGDCQTAALVGRDGSVDWLCWPRFDSPACFAALLGGSEHGHWKISPKEAVRTIRRAYRRDTLILETELETEEGGVTLIDFMPVRHGQSNLVRMVVGRRGRMAMHMEFVLRFDYGALVPWVTRTPDGKGVRAIAGPELVVLCAPVELEGRNMTSYGSEDLDAALLLIPMTGFLSATDPRVTATVGAIQRELTADGLVQRYRTQESVDGLAPGEGVFLACSFWLVDNLRLQGRRREARALFERLVGLANDVGLLAEEYDSATRRLLGNFPQAFSHVALVNSALNLCALEKPAEQRAEVQAA